MEAKMATVNLVRVAPAEDVAACKAECKKVGFSLKDLFRQVIVRVGSGDRALLDTIRGKGGRRK